MLPPAYRVPFEVTVDGACIAIRNAGPQDLPWVRVDVLGPVLHPAVTPGRMDAGASVVVRVRGEDVALRSRLQVTWMRSIDDGPYVWRRAL